MQKLLSFCSTLSLVVLNCIVPTVAKAQITPDGTTATEVITEGNNNIIDRGDRTGDSLFHSFEDFSIPTGGSATFNNATDIVNIFSRVTGNNISNIDGLLGANGTANLYLINPNGIIFGENASLNLGGSFFASTASSLLFEGNAEFSAVDPSAAPLLNVSIPIGASFRDNPGDIAVNGSLLEVANGEIISLVGGNVDIAGLANGSIFAIEGRVNLASAIEAGNITIADDAIDLPDTLARGDVTLRDFAFISVAGNRGGDIKIDARNITFTGGEFGASEISSGIVETGGDNARGGDILLNATETVSLVEGNIFNQVLTGSRGEGGETRINARNLIVENGTIAANLFGEGSTGKIAIAVTENVTLNSFGSISNGIGETGIGNSGGVEISSDSLEISDRSFIGSQNAGEGNPGGIAIETGEFIFRDRSEISSVVFESGMGDAGSIDIDAENLVISLQSTITSNTAGEGNGGDINLDVADSIAFDSGGDITSASLSTATGNGGNITLNSSRLTMGSGNFITTETSGMGNAGNIEINSSEIDLKINAAIFTNSAANAEGQAGKIDINTVTLNLERDGEGTEGSSTSISSSTLGNGDANDINIVASESISLTGQSSIQSNVARNEFIDVINGEGVLRIETGNGNAGNITISTGSLTLENGGQIFSSTEGLGNAGNIEIVASDRISISGIGRGIGDNIFVSSIASDVSLGSAVGNAGTITIDTSNLIVKDLGSISAATFGEGNASDITVRASEAVAIDNGSISSTTSELSIGDGGNISIDSPRVNINNNGEVNASSVGEGNGGNIFINAETMALDRGNLFTANVPLNNSSIDRASLIGGNINLEITDLITLNNDSLVTAQAGSNASGGNINIDSDIILAFPGNNDIIANAEVGRGGNIDINTEAIFGIQERTITPFSNDINASSEFGLAGSIAINTPEIDPTSGLIELPDVVGDASDRIAQNICQQGVGSEFIITGKGGLPPNVHQSLSRESTQAEIIEPVATQNLENGEILSRQDKAKKLEENIASQSLPAQGWVFNDRGEVTLIPDSTLTEHRSSDLQQTCL